MSISYKRLFHLLLDKNMKPSDLLSEITWPTISKLQKNEDVHTKTIGKICKLLNCQPGDIMEYVPSPDDEPEK